jgi:hypothetical protein
VNHRSVAAAFAALVTLAAMAALAPFAVAAPAIPAADGPGPPSGRSAILVLIPQARSADPDYDDRITRGLARIPELSVGLTSATQGSYVREQALLDISQGTRVSRSTYSPSDVPAAGPLATTRMVGGPGRLVRWNRIVARAETAPQTIEPGLMAGSIPGGAAFAGDPAAGSAIPAADREGRISAVFPEAPPRLVTAAARQYGLVVVSARPGPAGLADLRRVVALRDPDQLVIATQSPPDAAILPLLPIGVAGLEGPPGGLTSDTTNLPGLVAGIDIAPTVLDHLGIAIPEEMKGQVMRADGDRDPASFTPYRDRLDDLGPRRTPVLVLLGAAWLALFLAWGAMAGASSARLPVRRIGGLAVLWIPTMTLVPAALGNPSREVEYAVIVFGCLGLGWLSDRLLPWPRAPLIPAIVGLGAITVDLALGSHLITRSVLGPNPGYGSRFYGVGNELKSGLMVLLLAGLGAALTGRPKSKGAAAIVLAAGLVLGVILGSGRLGAGVGAAIIVASASAVAAMMMLPGAMSKKRVAILVVSPVIGLALLFALDALTADGQGHLSNSVLSLDSPSGFLETVERRSTLAWQQLWRDSMPLVTLICLLAAAWAIRNREIFRPFAGPIWPAALVGGLTGGLIGSVTEDSGPLLIVVATITLAGLCSYLLGRTGDRNNDPGDSSPETGTAAGAAPPG